VVAADRGLRGPQPPGGEVVKLPREVAGFDSATAMLIALARFLHGQQTPPMGKSAFRMLGPVAAAVARLPEPARQQIYSVFSGAEGQPEHRLATLDAEKLAGAVADLYPVRKYPAVAVGSSGGASTHLCAALGIPWLPQTLLLPVRQRGIDPDRPEDAGHAFDRTARALLDNNPDLVLHHMHDPNQDRLTLRRMAYFRIKRMKLGAAYRRFLTDRLEPGGIILLTECGQRWPVTTIGERHLFQFGAIGGLSPDEYRDGNPRVRDYLRRYGAPVERWNAPPVDADAPEAEWGFEEGLRDDVEQFADSHGYQVRRLVYDEPEDLSPLVADLYRWYWTTFPVQPSLDNLAGYLDRTEAFDRMHLALFCHGVDSVGGVTADQWRDLLRRARVDGSFAGVRPDRYPSDPRTFFEFPRALRAIPERHPLPAPLEFPAFADFVENQAGSYPGVRLLKA
jgi:hypothetical protein